MKIKELIKLDLSIPSNEIKKNKLIFIEIIVGGLNPTTTLIKRYKI